jgi:hypothetical protein
MDPEQARLVMEQVRADGHGQQMGPEAQPTQASSQWRGSARWLFACLGSGGLLMAAVLAWGHWEFGSLSNTLAYLNGERLLIDPGTVSFGIARRGEERNAHVTIRNRTGKEVKFLGAKSTCACMGVEEKFPFSIADKGQKEVSIRVWFTSKDSVFKKRVDFYTDDEANPVLAIAVHGTITD